MLVLVLDSGLVVFSVIAVDDMLVVYFASFFFKDFAGFEIFIADATIAAAVVAVSFLLVDCVVAFCEIIAIIKGLLIAIAGENDDLLVTFVAIFSLLFCQCQC